MDTWSDARIVSLKAASVKAFLQGYLTCNSDRIRQNAPTPMTLCNLQGRVIANGWAIGDECVLLVVHQSVAVALAAFLKPYAMFSKCSVEAHNHAVAVASGASGSNSFTDHWCFADNLLDASQSNAGDQSSAIARDLVSNRFSWVSDGVAGKFLPQVLGMHEVGAVDFDKGCYLGQEIVARAQFRGAVKRGIDIFEWHGQLPMAGDDWTDNAHGKGTVTICRGEEECRQRPGALGKEFVDLTFLYSGALKRPHLRR